MKYFISRSISILFLSFGLTACSPSMGSREQGGTAAGAVAGAILGSLVGGDIGGRIAGALIGAAIGGVIGNRIGAALDEQDRRQLAEITQRTGSTGSARSFRNARTGVSARTRVVATSRNAQGQACRQVDQEVVLRNGTVERDRVQFCRTANGWAV